MELKQLQEPSTISKHVADKAWVDYDSWDAAYTTARALFPPKTNDDSWASAYVEPLI